MKNLAHKFILAGVLAAGAAGAQTPPPPGYTPPPIPEEGNGGNTVTIGDINNTNNNTNNNNNSATGGNASASANGGNSSNVNEFRSFVAGSAPGLAAAVDTCLAVVGTSGSVGFGGSVGVSLALGKTKAEFNTACAAVQSALTIFGQANGDTTLQLAALEILSTQLPGIAQALEEAGKRMTATEIRCQGSRPTSVLAFYSAAGGCTGGNTAAAPTAGTTAPAAPTTITVNVDVKGVTAAPAARSTSGAKPKARSTSGAAKPKATTGSATGATGQNGCTSYSVTVCPAAPRR